MQEDPDAVPLIVLDECHKAKNLINDQGVPTLCGVAVEHLQQRCPNAAVLYSSATGISEPTNMAYMTRVGKCGYNSMLDLIQNLEKAGLGASELFSCTLKSNGVYLARCALFETKSGWLRAVRLKGVTAYPCRAEHALRWRRGAQGEAVLRVLCGSGLRYVCRQLSYEGAEFQLEMIELDPRFQVQYARAAATWQAFSLFWLRPEIFGRGVTEKGGKARGIATGFWGTQQRFFRAMLMAAKVPALAREARAAIEADCAVVIGLQSTGEANQKAEVEANGA